MLEENNVKFSKLMTDNKPYIKSYWSQTDYFLKKENHT